MQKDYRSTTSQLYQDAKASYTCAFFAVAQTDIPLVVTLENNIHEEP